MHSSLAGINFSQLRLNLRVLRSFFMVLSSEYKYRVAAIGLTQEMEYVMG